MNTLGASDSFIVLIMCHIIFFLLYVSLTYISAFRIISISADLILPCILPVVLVCPILGLFIHVVDLSSLLLKCSSSSVWLQFLC